MLQLFVVSIACSALPVAVTFIYSNGSVFKAVLLLLVTVLVLSRVDYGNKTLAGLSARQLGWLQSILHVTARIVFSAR